MYLRIRTECITKHLRYPSSKNGNGYADVLQMIHCCTYLVFCLVVKIWTKISIKNLRHLPEKSNKHELLKCYLDNEMSLAVLRNVNSKFCL